MQRSTEEIQKLEKQIHFKMIADFVRILNTFLDSLDLNVSLNTLKDNIESIDEQIRSKQEKLATQKEDLSRQVKELEVLQAKYPKLVKEKQEDFTTDFKSMFNKPEAVEKQVQKILKLKSDIGSDELELKQLIDRKQALQEHQANLEHRPDVEELIRLLKQFLDRKWNELCEVRFNENPEAAIKEYQKISNEIFVFLYQECYSREGEEKYRKINSNPIIVSMKKELMSLMVIYGFKINELILPQDSKRELDKNELLPAQDSERELDKNVLLLPQDVEREDKNVLLLPQDGEREIDKNELIPPPEAKIELDNQVRNNNRLSDIKKAKELLSIIQQAINNTTYSERSTLVDYRHIESQLINFIYKMQYQINKSERREKEELIRLVSTSKGKDKPATNQPSEAQASPQKQTEIYVDGIKVVKPAEPAETRETLTQAALEEAIETKNLFEKWQLRKTDSQQQNEVNAAEDPRVAKKKPKKSFNPQVPYYREVPDAPSIKTAPTFTELFSGFTGKLSNIFQGYYGKKMPATVQHLYDFSKKTDPAMIRSEFIKELQNFVVLRTQAALRKQNLTYVEALAMFSSGDIAAVKKPFFGFSAQEEILAALKVLTLYGDGNASECIADRILSFTSTDKKVLQDSKLKVVMQKNGVTIHQLEVSHDSLRKNSNNAWLAIELKNFITNQVGKILGQKNIKLQDALTAVNERRLKSKGFNLFGRSTIHEQILVAFKILIQLKDAELSGLDTNTIDCAFTKQEKKVLQGTSVGNILRRNGYNPMRAEAGGREKQPANFIR